MRVVVEWGEERGTWGLGCGKQGWEGPQGIDGAVTERWEEWEVRVLVLLMVFAAECSGSCVGRLLVGRADGGGEWLVRREGSATREGRAVVIVNEEEGGGQLVISVWG